MGLAKVLWDSGRWNLGVPSKRAKQFGGHLRHDQSSFTLRCTTPMPLQVDGDYLGKRSTIVFRSVPDAVRVFL